MVAKWKWSLICTAAAASLVLAWFLLWRSGAESEKMPGVREGESAVASAASTRANEPALAMTPVQTRLGAVAAQVPSGPTRILPPPPLEEQAAAAAGAGGKPAPLFDERLVNDPPRIPLNVKNATLPEVVEALNKELGPHSVLLTMPVRPTAARARAGAAVNKTYTLDVKDAAFWDIFKSLQDQAAFQVSSRSHGLQWLEGPPGVPQFWTAGPVMVYASKVTRDTAVEGQMNLNLMTVVDPRFRVIRRVPVILVDATDDQGKVFVQQAVSTTLEWRGALSNAWEQPVVIATGEMGAGRKVNLRFLVQFEVPLREIEVKMENVGANITRPVSEMVTLGTHSLRVTQISANARQMDVQLSGEQAMTPMPPLKLVVQDGTGKEIGWTVVPAGGGLSRMTLPLNGSPPYRLVVRTPDEVRVVSQVVEMKDVVVP